MVPVPANPFLGVSFHGIGAMLAANCYAPQKFIRRWSWEIFWMTQAVWCWLLWPIIGAVCTIPQLGQVLAESPKDAMAKAFVFGMVYGVGGTCFNLAIRYIGFALTYAVAVGLSAILGTITTPLLEGTIGEKLHAYGAGWVAAGMGLGVLGIAGCGLAGRLKELDFRDQHGDSGEFSLAKGLPLAILAGVLSAVYGIGINDVALPIVKIAASHGAGHWQGNIALPFVNSGAFVAALLYSLFLAKKNRSLGELTRLRPGPERASLTANYFLAFLTGTLWYGQFFFYNLGHVRMGHYQFVSWAVHMIMLVLFSNLTGVLFREWRGCRDRTRAAITAALLVLLTSVVMISYGNYLGDLPPAKG